MHYDLFEIKVLLIVAAAVIGLSLIQIGILHHKIHAALQQKISSIELIRLIDVSTGIQLIVGSIGLSIFVILMMVFK